VDETVLKAGDHHGSTFYHHQKFRKAVLDGAAGVVTMEDTASRRSPSGPGGRVVHPRGPRHHDRTAVVRVTETPSPREEDSLPKASRERGVSPPISSSWPGVEIQQSRVGA
jgi:hypothetical protein